MAHSLSFVLLFLVCLSPVVFCNSLPKNATEIIRSYGYETEEHWVQTLDGYLLLMNRIKTKGKPIGVAMFEHGLMDSSMGIVLATLGEGLPWMLVDQGYELWLGNNRGNGWSMRHVKWTPNDDEFWDFSWEDMALYDFPAMINYVLSVSKFSRLTYMGHSEGTIQAFSGFIANPGIADKVSLYVALAPVGYVGHLGSLLLQILANTDVDKIFQFLGVQKFGLPEFIDKFLPNLCKDVPSACYFPLEIVMGPSSHVNVSRIPYILNYEPNWTSVKNMVHWAQSVRSNTFSRFDYGPIKNLERYGSVNPPAFKFSDFPQNLNTVLFTGTNDYLADPTDVKRMLAELPISPLVYETDYGHIDFLWAVDVKEKVYNIILQLMKKFPGK